MKNLIQTEGIILERTAFKDYNILLTLLTEEHSLVKVTVKAGANPKRNLLPHLQLLNRVEFEFRKSEQELSHCTSIQLIDPFLHLRMELKRLEAAGDFVRVITAIRSHSKESYQLLRRFLEGLANADNFDTLRAAFRLKLLYHEGFINPETLTLEQQDILFIRNFQQLQEKEATSNLLEEVENLFLLVTN